MDMQHHSAADLARRFGLELRGEGDTQVSGVAPLSRATATELSFLSNPRLRDQLASTGAGIVVLREGDAGSFAGTALVAHDPYVAYAKIAALFEPKRPSRPGIHPSAVVDPTAQVHPEAEIGPLVSIGARSSIGAGCVIGPGCVIGEDYPATIVDHAVERQRAIGI